MPTTRGSVRGQLVSLPRVAGHRDGCTTDCPGYDMYVNGMPALRSSVARLVAGRLHGLTLAVGRGQGSAKTHSPYSIAPGAKVTQARYLELATVTMTAGLQLPLQGALRSFAGAPVRSAVIVLQNLTDSRKREEQTEVGRATTGHDGEWAVALTPQSNLLVRALHADAPAAVSGLIVVAVAPDITLGLGPSDGGPIQVLGNVEPFKRRVTIEVTAVGRKHHVVLRKILTPDADNGFEALLRLPAGRYWVTARTAADAENIAGSSPSVELRI